MEHISAWGWPELDEEVEEELDEEVLDAGDNTVMWADDWQELPSDLVICSIKGYVHADTIFTYHGLHHVNTRPPEDVHTHE
jgi:hypothetical protein